MAAKLSRGEKIAAAAALLLFASMFLDWFGREVPGVPDFGGLGGGGEQAAFSAWEAMDVVPLFLMLAVAVALAVAVVRLIGADLGLPISPNTVVAAVGALAVLLILYRIVDPPALPGLGGVGVETTRRLGAFIGLVAAAGIAYGGYRAMREEGVTFGDEAERLSRKPGSDPSR